MRPYGILELARTGRIALVRGASRGAEEADVSDRRPRRSSCRPAGSTRRWWTCCGAEARATRIRVTQTVRVGARTWTATVDGTFRGIDYLATGITTDRVPEDDIVVPTVHFTKDNGELTQHHARRESRVEVGVAVRPFREPRPQARPAGALGLCCLGLVRRASCWHSPAAASIL